MCEDEFVGRIVVAEIAQEAAPIHPDLEILPHLEMQVRFVLAEVVPDASNLLAPAHLVTLLDTEFQQVAIQRIDVFQFRAFVVGVADNDDVAPANMVIPGKDDNAVGRGIHRVAQVRIAAPHAIPIFAEVSIRPVTARNVVAFTRAIRPYGKLKPIRRTHDGRVLRSQGQGTNQKCEGTKKRQTHGPARIGSGSATGNPGCREGKRAVHFSAEKEGAAGPLRSGKCRNR